MIDREITREMLAAAREYPIVTVLGPRQSGKMTLVRTVFPAKPYRSLEDPDVRGSCSTARRWRTTLAYRQ
jgi:hypothetical protein